MIRDANVRIFYFKKKQTEKNTVVDESKHCL